ncbi:MAG: alkaline phosphatase family protein [Elusimicrobia bacterium]|nr:alkaline phosphatase family protein [Elusimicrobiota bacterium]
MSAKSAALRYIDPGSGYTILTTGGWIIAFLLGLLGTFTLFFRRIFGFFGRNKKKITILVIIAAAAGLIVTGAIMSMKRSPFDKKIIILGFDGLSPGIVEEMMNEGRLPSFFALKEKGSYRRLATTNPAQSPVAWAAFSTGQNPGKNGVYDFIVRDPRTYGLSLSLSETGTARAKRVIKSRCLWQYTSQRKIPTVVISCPVTFPPDKIYGRMLSGMGVPDILGTEGTFTFYTTAPLRKDKDTGGKVFEVRKSSAMSLNLIGPKVAAPGGKAVNAKIPFKVHLQGRNSVRIRYQKTTLELKAGCWSDWQEVVFELGLFRKARGIFKFYLVETQPEFKLYISPINFDPRKPFFPISYPEGYSRELAKELGLYYTQGMPMDTWAVNEKRLTEEPFLEQVREVLREKRAMLDFELARFKKGFLFCYFESPDIIQHMFWRYRDPGHPLFEKNAPEEYKEVIPEWYRKMDEILGSVMEKLGEGDTLIVLSDHGFDTFRRAAHVNTWLRKNGYLELKDPHAGSGGGLLRDIDWSRTQAYSIGFGAIYINQKDRERDGIVNPGKETEDLKRELSRKLKEWRDDKYNKPMVNNVYLKEEIFWGDYADEAPDLYIGFNIGYRASWQTALGAVPRDLVEDNLKKWSGSHLFDPELIPGVIFSNRKITKENPSIYDITPTILAISGFEDESLKEYDFDGEPLFN